MKSIVFITLFFGILLISCNKVYESPEKALSGKYDWRATVMNDLYTYTPGAVGKNYGIQIKRNGKVRLYEDGKLIEELQAGAFGRYPSSTTYHTEFSLNNTLISVNLTGTTLTVYNWPYPDENNEFIDLKELP